LQKFDSSRGQSSIEFVLLVTAVLFFFVIFLFVVNTRIAEAQQEANRQELYSIGEYLVEELTLATISTSGYIRTFYLPPTINSLDYTISIVDGSVYIRTDDGKHAASFSSPAVVGQPLIGNNQIKNIHGVVYLNP
jgi:uncharacterized protein (UPF0333 family)